MDSRALPATRQDQNPSTHVSSSAGEHFDDLINRCFAFHRDAVQQTSGRVGSGVRDFPDVRAVQQEARGEPVQVQLLLRLRLHSRQGDGFRSIGV